MWRKQLAHLPAASSTPPSKSPGLPRLADTRFRSAPATRATPSSAPALVHGRHKRLAAVRHLDERQPVVVPRANGVGGLLKDFRGDAGPQSSCGLWTWRVFGKPKIGLNNSAKFQKHIDLCARQSMKFSINRPTACWQFRPNELEVTCLLQRQ